ncbi:hypothetical protein B0T20DRAFT_478768 [Sordaria brevicollis]|uniref:Uncharacterized protein n=1 Tax=Sordaria brevicollis TaxID=83679 RepID=A0AAE0PGL7_SORBR|nr:hypothetical protein B0T20DRAFT_478768 [Sordaria brevicollis]
MDTTNQHAGTAAHNQEPQQPASHGGLDTSQFNQDIASSDNSNLTPADAEDELPQAPAVPAALHIDMNYQQLPQYDQHAPNDWRNMLSPIVPIPHFFPPHHPANVQQPIVDEPAVIAQPQNVLHIAGHIAGSVPYVPCRSDAPRCTEQALVGYLTRGANAEYNNSPYPLTLLIAINAYNDHLANGNQDVDMQSISDYQSEQ